MQLLFHAYWLLIARDVYEIYTYPELALQAMLKTDYMYLDNESDGRDDGSGRVKPTVSCPDVVIEPPKPKKKASSDKMKELLAQQSKANLKYIFTLLHQDEKRIAAVRETIRQKHFAERFRESSKEFTPPINIPEYHDRIICRKFNLPPSRSIVT